MQRRLRRGPGCMSFTSKVRLRLHDRQYLSSQQDSWQQREAVRRSESNVLATSPRVKPKAKLMKAAGNIALDRYRHLLREPAALADYDFAFASLLHPGKPLSMRSIKRSKVVSQARVRAAGQTLLTVK